MIQISLWINKEGNVAERSQSLTRTVAVSMQLVTLQTGSNGERYVKI